MVTINSIPGYLTLSEAEEKYGVKADTLKKRCQKGDIIGAKIVGKTWFVPDVPGIDPSRTFPENYPLLNFKEALAFNNTVYDAESEARMILYNQFKGSIYIWEYGFYFFSLIFKHTHLNRNYMHLAAVITEANSALRSSFLLNLYGYHSDAIALLRKTHECTIKALAMRTDPKKTWSIGLATSREKSEQRIGVNFELPWKFESSFVHANGMKLMETAKDMFDPNKTVSVSYGPQIDNKDFAVGINTGIFWLYILTKSLSYIFQGQITDQWLEQKESSAKLLKDYLSTNKAFIKELQSFDVALAKLEQKKA